MVTIVHIYNRWKSSEIKCYANGQLVSCCEMNWHIGGSDVSLGFCPRYISFASLSKLPARFALPSFAEWR